tara:strand:+ start:1422 stop:1685 length:264 start_codon:yes stop_codon:yes gene_type:complete
MEEYSQFIPKGSGSNIKFVVNIVGLLGAMAGGWYKLESRVSDLERQLEQQEKVKSIQREIELMERDQQLEELKWQFKLDSLKMANND